jgi:hypothetical protein
VITQPLEGGMLEILQAEDAVDVIISVLLTARRYRFKQASLVSKWILIGTTTNIAYIWKYTKQPLIELLFEAATKKIAKSGIGCAGISL